MNRMAAVAAAIALGLVGASPVSASSPADTQYGNPLTQTTPNGAGASSHGLAPVSSGDLPFTGLDLGLAVAGGLTLAGLGLGLRRLSRRSSR
jgi:hypothetical protein